MMNTTKNNRARIRAIPHKGSRSIWVAAAFLLFSGLASQFIPWPPALNSVPSSILSIVILAAAGVLLFFCDKRDWLPLVSMAALTIAVYLFYSATIPGVALFAAIAALLILLSAIGWRRNTVAGFLPKPVALPILNLLSLVLTLFCILAASRAPEIAKPLARGTVSPLLSYAYLLVRLLPLVSILLINISSETQRFDANAAPKCTRAVGGGGARFAAASWLLLIGGAANTLITLFSVYDVNAFLLSIPLLAAGVLLVLGGGDEKRFIAAMACLLLSVSPSFFRAGYYTSSNYLLYSLPILLMLISSVGALRNSPLAFLSKLIKSPVLNVIAALLLAISLVSGSVSTLMHNSSATPWHTIALFIIKFSLVLLNLSLDSRELARRDLFSAFFRLCGRIVRWFYRDVGGRLQLLAKLQAVVCMVLACMSALFAAIGLCGFLVDFLFVGSYVGYLMYFAVGIAGIAASFILALPTWLLYAFGQITADLREVKDTGGLAAATIEENPDELPEL
jgi:hypothetical protein